MFFKEKNKYIVVGFTFIVVLIIFFLPDNIFAGNRSDNKNDNQSADALQYDISAISETSTTTEIQPESSDEVMPTTSVSFTEETLALTETEKLSDDLTISVSNDTNINDNRYSYSDDIDGSVTATVNSDGTIKIEYTEFPLTLTLPSSWNGRFVIRHGCLCSKATYASGFYDGKLASVGLKDISQGSSGASKVLGKTSDKYCYYYRVTDVRYDMDDAYQTEEYNSLRSDIDWIMDNAIFVAAIDPYEKGEISSNGLEIEGYTSDYICDGGAKSRQWICEDTWHITAKAMAYSHGLVWYECWDTDDGDYYGWIDSEYLYFYDSGFSYKKPNLRSSVTDLYTFAIGEISSNGMQIVGFTTDYICNGGPKSEQWICEDTWHITAKRVIYSYEKTWYECWDTDDGDYYGWIDSNYLRFY